MTIKKKEIEKIKQLVKDSEDDFKNKSEILELKRQELAKLTGKPYQ